MRSKFIYSLTTFLVLSISICWAQMLPSPKEHFGFNIGDDYHLATYTQTEAYFKKLAVASDRVKLVDIGVTEEGRHQYMLIVSSPENIRNLNRYKEISQKLARAEDLTEEQAQQLASEGKSVIWIDGGLHATETVGAHQLIETIWQLVSRNDPETLRILDHDIVLLAHANPDGQELVSSWYMRESKPEKRSFEHLPRLYQKYVGHDNNRDFYMMNMKESQNISRQLFVEWIPQIMYNHHQRGPAGSVLAGPPYRDPFNYVYDPLLVTSIDAVGAAMNNRLNVEGKPGYTQRTGSSFSTWWNGGLRTTPYFHNIIGLLTEIIGGPNPEEVPLIPQRLLPNGATPNPITPQEWHFRQSIDYSVSLNYAVLDYAARYSDELLYNIYRMGKNSIQRGSSDYWALSPKHVDAISLAYKNDQSKDSREKKSESNGRRSPGNLPAKHYDEVLKNPDLRSPRGYILPANQGDFPTAVRFINALVQSGVLVHKATAEFTVADKTYPAGSYIVKTDQAFRPHVIDMFEPQEHPNDFQHEGGPPIRPYDAAGWTLAYQMGVAFDRMLDAFDGPFQRVPYGQLQSPAKQKIASSSSAAGYLLRASSNNSFIAVNDLLHAEVDVYRLQSKIAGTPAADAGTFFVPATDKATTLLTKSAAELGIEVTGIEQTPANNAMIKVSPMRIALWDTYGGSIPSGWVRWLMEQYHFPVQIVYPQDIDAGDLRKKFDVIVFVNRAIPSVNRQNQSYYDNEPKPKEIPTEYRSQLGSITTEKSVPQLKQFMEAGGTVVTMGSSTDLAYHLGLPVRDAIVEMKSDGVEYPLPGTKYYIPGSILRVNFDSTQPAAWGMPSEGDIYFNNSPVFKIAPDAIAKGKVEPLVWFSSSKPLRSGWAWGEAYLKDGVTAFVASVGSGKLYAFGPEITFRGQSHGTFKLLFNQLYACRPGSTAIR
ncbi:M14 metallopeptidase family protein [Pontibacter silvestris]|uniref:M14 metallopeptidase family protein n=1 Tax=Pontibacter silvestris TaxID=2305183 RepID=A0ABW4X5K2_9BACT|nr:M14 metallopeptidase family protein [Pontibacter silvestris]MCC9137179.1 M14 family metallopeptidase [Pontibacter silvestris]